MKPAGFGPAGLLVACLLLAGAPRSAPAQEAAAESPRAADHRGPGVALLSGREIPGRVARVTADGFVVDGEDAPVPRYEVQEIRFDPVSELKPPELDTGPIVRFRSGETLVARVLSVDGDAARLRVDGLGEFVVPLESIGAFRLREEHDSDRSFLEALEALPPPSDAVWARTGNDILRVDGVFRGLDDEYLRFERSGRVGRMRRRLVHGLALAPVASTRREADPPEVFEWLGVGQLPAYLKEISDESVEVRFPGAPEDALVTLPRKGLARIIFASDRVVFLSTLEPSRAEETPVVGTPLGYEKDKSIGGGPLQLDGRTYRRGLGVRSRTVLEYPLGGVYRSFGAVIGVDDAAGDRGGVTFRVLADGKEIYRKDLRATDPPVAVSLPVEGIGTLGLEVGYGPDGTDLGDHADWAAARVTR